MSFANDYLALRALAERLTPLFAADGDYGIKLLNGDGIPTGADVVLARDEDTTVERMGKPYLLIDLIDATSSEWSSCDSEYRMVTALVVACADDSSGAQTGAANPITSPELMSRDLVVDIKANYMAYHDSGMQGVKVQADRPAITKSDDEAPGTTTLPHRVTFHYEVS